jgi:hypothetical protein
VCHIQQCVLLRLFDLPTLQKQHEKELKEAAAAAAAAAKAAEQQKAAEEAAAVKIQSIQRGRLARRKAERLKVGGQALSYPYPYS